MNQIYLDANLFIFAELDKSENGDNARKIIKSLKNFNAVTSILTMDEVIWKLKKQLDYETAIFVGEKFFQLPLSIIPITTEIGLISIGLMKRYKLNPRDAIHVACMIDKGVDSIISEDSDFDRIKEIERIGFKKSLSRI